MTARITSPLFAEFGRTRVPYKAFRNDVPREVWAGVEVYFYSMDDQGQRVYIDDPDAARALLTAALERYLVGKLAASRIAPSQAASS